MKGYENERGEPKVKDVVRCYVTVLGRGLKNSLKFQLKKSLAVLQDIMLF